MLVLECRIKRYEVSRWCHIVPNVHIPTEYSSNDEKDGVYAKAQPVFEQFCKCRTNNLPRDSSVKTGKDDYSNRKIVSRFYMKWSSTRRFGFNAG